MDVTEWLCDKRVWPPAISVLILNLILEVITFIFDSASFVHSYLYLVADCLLELLK